MMTISGIVGATLKNLFDTYNAGTTVDNENAFKDEENLFLITNSNS